MRVRVVIVDFSWVLVVCCRVPCGVPTATAPALMQEDPVVSWTARAVVAYSAPLDAPPPSTGPRAMWTATGDDGALLEAFLFPGGALEVRRYPGAPLVEMGGSTLEEQAAPLPPNLLELQALVDAAFPAKEERPTPVLAVLFLSNGDDATYPEPRGYYAVGLNPIGQATPNAPPQPMTPPRIVGNAGVPS